ncbi:hypothetical protein ACFQXA_27150 [Nocardiopsis composta]
MGARVAVLIRIRPAAPRRAGRGAGRQWPERSAAAEVLPRDSAAEAAAAASRPAVGEVRGAARWA